MLRCKKGDLAIVLRSESDREGIIISVLEYVGAYTLTSGETMTNGWRVTGPRLEDEVTHYFAEDKVLLPIRPGDLKEVDEAEKEVESVVS